jgi:hypothetical protein
MQGSHLFAYASMYVNNLLVHTYVCMPTCTQKLRMHTHLTRRPADLPKHTRTIDCRCKHAYVIRKVMWASGTHTYMIAEYIQGCTHHACKHDGLHRTSTRAYMMHVCMIAEYIHA